MSCLWQLGLWQMLALLEYLGKTERVCDFCHEKLEILAAEGSVGQASHKNDSFPNPAGQRQPGEPQQQLSNQNPQPTSDDTAAGGTVPSGQSSRKDETQAPPTGREE